MKSVELSTFPYSPELLVPEAEVPIKYTLPFTWGSLKMSEAAHAAYGLSPLVEGKLAGDVHHEAAKGIPEVNVYILSPDELDADEEASPEQPDPDDLDSLYIGVRHKAYMSPSSIGLALCLTDDKKGLETQLISKVTRKLGIEEEEIDERIVAVTQFGEEAASETFKRDVPEMMVHAFTGGITNHMVEPNIEWLRLKMNQRMHKLTKLAGLAAVTGGGLYTGLDLVLGGGTAGIVTGDILFVGVPLGVGWRGFRYYLDSNNYREQQIRESTTKFSLIIGQGFHESYCHAHFNKRVEGWTEGSAYGPND